jgi:predicted nuclease of predicted toxin-antitoxin system
VRFLIDNSLSPRLASLLGELGHDAVHLRSFGKQDAEDLEVFEIAASQDRVIVAQDTDFGAIDRRSTIDKTVTHPLSPRRSLNRRFVRDPSG